LPSLPDDAVILLKAVVPSQRKLRLEWYTLHNINRIKTQNMTGTRYLFISDLHLDPSRVDVSQAFIDYLNTLSKQDVLYILGDLFEVWLGDDDDNEFNLSMIEALSQCQGDVYLMHGNRDFLIGSKFADQANLTLLPDPFIVNLLGEPVLLLHGDSLCTLDTQYMAVREMLRSESFQAELLSKTLLERAEIAQQARNESQLHTSQTEMQIMDVTPEEVQRMFAEHQVTTMIHGHTHRPFDHFDEADSPPFRRMVLGDWGQYGWQIIAADSTLELSRFPIG